MGNQLNKLSSISKAHQKGFIQVKTSFDNSLSDNEFYGYHLEFEPESRDYYIRGRNAVIFLDDGDAKKTA